MSIAAAPVLDAAPTVALSQVVDEEVRFITPHADEPYGMGLSEQSILYVANRDSDMINTAQSGTATMLASGNGLDASRNVVAGPVYIPASGASGASAEGAPAPPDNDAPSLSLNHDGASVSAPVSVASGERTVLRVAATDPDGDGVTLRATSDEIPAAHISMEDRSNETALLALDTAGLAASAAGTPYAFWINAPDGRDHGLEPYAVLVTAAADPEN